MQVVQCLLKNPALICQKSGGVLHKVEFKSTGETMLENAQILQEEELLLRLNNVPNAADAVANDVQYHLLCWTNFKKRALKKSAEFEGCNQEINDPEKILADIEIINIVNCMVRGNEFLDMNIVNMTYNNLLGSTESHINYKRYLKGLLQENVQDISFSRSKSRRDPEVICSNASKDRAVDSFRCIPDEYNQLFEAAKTVRDDILKSPKWTFTGDYTGFEAPTSLTALLKWIIIGPKVEAGMYRSTTLGQIIDGKHMKRGVEAYSTMYLALFPLYVREAVKDSDINWLHITNKIMEITQSLDILHNTEENTVMMRVLCPFHKNNLHPPLPPNHRQYIIPTIFTR